jgi:undecaprenyl-diphosphatase
MGRHRDVAPKDIKVGTIGVNPWGSIRIILCGISYSMNIIESIILGIIQGITEFLPVSSSAHLVFIQNYFCITEPQVFYDCLLHMATLAVIIVYFREDIKKIFLNSYKIKEVKTNQFSRVFWLIVAGTVPTVIIGYFFKDTIEAVFGKIMIVAVLLMITGVIVFISDRIGNNSKREMNTGIRDALIIGFAQGIAILPGISRSGITIVACIILGLNRQWSAKYSLLLSVPAILGATVLKLKDAGFIVQSGMVITYLSGIITAFIVGYLALKVFIRVLTERKLGYFAYYCWLVGLMVILSQI